MNCGLSYPYFEVWKATPHHTANFLQGTIWPAPSLHQGNQVNQLADWLGTGPEQILDQLHFLQCSFVLSFHSDHDTAFSGKLALLKLYIFCDVNPIYIWGIQYAPCLHTIYLNCMFFCLACALFHYLFTEGNVKWVKS